ncbi:response regulator, partial [Treponema sp. OttesenSCG-928-L16]|nr:response regulator [Treponema sp. OttesenSCG-928-L16]
AAEHRDFLLLSDLVMPGISGTELAETLAEKHGDMKILFMSGYEADPELPPLLLGRKTAFIKKPFYYRQLLDAIDGLLQA